MLLFSVKVFGHFPPSSVALLKKLCPALTVVAATVMKVPDGRGSACNRTRPVRMSPPAAQRDPEVSAFGDFAECCLLGFRDALVSLICTKREHLLTAIYRFFSCWGRTGGSMESVRGTLEWTHSEKLGTCDLCLPRRSGRRCRESIACCMRPPGRPESAPGRPPPGRLRIGADGHAPSPTEPREGTSSRK